MHLIASVTVVVTGLAVLCAPLGFSYYLSAAFFAVGTGLMALRRDGIRAPSTWLLLCALLVVILAVNGVVAIVRGPQPAIYVVQAFVAIVASLLLLMVGFLLGQQLPTAFACLAVLYLIVRIVASPVLPLGEEMTELVEGYYRFESYQFVGLGTRVILPGDIAIIAAWLWTATSRLGEGRQRVLRLLCFLAALASFSRLLLIVLVSLEALRAAMLLRRRLGRLAVVVAATTVVAGIFVLGDPDVEVPVGASELYAARVIATSSTVTKIEQAEQLGEAIMKSAGVFTLGAGLGSFLPQLIRDEDRPFQYEVQLLSSFFQIGFVGFVLWMFAWTYPIVVVGRRLYRAGLSREALLVFGTGAWFIAGGAVNPVVLLPQNFVLFAIFGGLDRRADGEGAEGRGR